jgi:nicotinamide-nucleotide amidase
VSTTGVAGPESEEGVAVGTVFVGFAGPEGVECFELRLEGDPSEIRAQAVDFAIAQIGSMTPSESPIDEGPAERALLEC